MSRKGNGWDNACSKTVFGSLKGERQHGQRFETPRGVRSRVKAPGSPSCGEQTGSREEAVKKVEILNSFPTVPVTRHIHLLDTDSKGKLIFCQTRTQSTSRLILWASTPAREPASQFAPSWLPRTMKKSCLSTIAGVGAEYNS